MKSLLGLLVICSFALPFSTSAADNPAKPNILLIVIDDLGYGELSCQGNPQIPTPFIDSIAANGIRFTNGYVSCPVCSPTRAGLMTGRYQQRFGHEFNAGPVHLAPPNFGLPVKEKTIANWLKEAGYATGMFGKWHLGYKPELHPLKRGFDEYFGFLGGAHSYLDSISDRDHANPILRNNEPVPTIDYTTDAFGREAAAFIEKHQEKPWFVYLPFNAVHAPLQATEKYKVRFTSIEDQKRATFAAMLSAADDAVGTVLEKLRKLKIEENTLIFLISDNGGPTNSTTSSNVPLRGGKGSTWEGGIRVAWMAQWKNHIPAGKVDARPVIQLDILPTALAAADVKIPADAKLDGVNILPLLTGKSSEPPHKALFWRFGKQRAVRMGDWKLTDTPQGGVQLSNVTEDISEKTDLAAKEPEKLKELETAWQEWNKQNIEPAWPPDNSEVRQERKKKREEGK